MANIKNCLTVVNFLGSVSYRFKQAKDKNFQKSRLFFVVSLSCCLSKAASVKSDKSSGKEVWRIS